jgi:hypothetical protein
LRAAAVTFEARWKSEPPIGADGLPDEAASLVTAAVTVADGYDDPSAADALEAVIRALDVLASLPSGSPCEWSKTAASRRRAFLTAAHAIAKQLEPPSAIVAATARADHGLDLVADETAAESAPRGAAAAAVRMNLLRAILGVLPDKERHPPRKPRDERREGADIPARSSVDVPPPPPSGKRPPLIIELIDDDEPAGRGIAGVENEDGGEPQSTSLNDDTDMEIMSVATAAALAAAAYAKAATVHGAGGLPGWSSPEAAEAARVLLQRTFASRASGATTSSGSEYSDFTREILAKCLSEAAPSIAHCLAQEPEQRWAGESSARDKRAPGPPTPELPVDISATLQPASVETSVIAAVRLHWLLSTAGYPWVGRVGSGKDGGVGGVVSRVVPCILRAMDHNSPAVRREGCAALVALVAAVTRTEMRWHGAALLDAAANTLGGSGTEVFGAAAAAHVRATIAVSSDDPHEPKLANALAVMIDAANSRSHEPLVAAAWVIEAPALISAAKLSTAPHLNRLFPPLLSWLHARDDDTALGAASCLELICTMTWPRVPAHAAELWSDIARAYSEADVRGDDAFVFKFRAALTRVADVVQLAAGENFEPAWRRDGDPVPPALEPLVAHLEGLPGRVASTEWSRPSN